jgi:HK97 family phage portal protein
MKGNVIHRLANWLARKTAPAALTGGQWTGTSYTDRFKKYRNPTPNELMAELKNTAWACASLNAGTCAAYPPSLYVITRHNEPSPKCRTKALKREREEELRSHPRLRGRLKSAERLEEVTTHPLLDLLNYPNPWHSSYDLWELTTLYLEVLGEAYWYLEPGAFGVPGAIWLLPAQNVKPKRNPGSSHIVDYYQYQSGAKQQLFAVDEIIQFRYPDPRDPYAAGLAPLRACYEQVAILADYAALRQSKLDNSAIPDVVLSPDEVIGEEERDRLETQWNQKFRRGGSGRALVAESGMKVSVLQHSLGDLAALADCNATKLDVCNAFHVPTAFFTTQTNLANLLASESQHMQQAIEPRLRRRDETLNSMLVPLYDDTGRLFLASEDPVPDDSGAILQQQQMDLQYGVVSINEVRGGRGLPPVPWGNLPWLPTRWAPTDVPRVQPGEAAVAESGKEAPESEDYGK